MVSWQDNIIRGTMLLRAIYGQSITAHPAVDTASALSVWPHVDTRTARQNSSTLINTLGGRATGVIVYPAADVHFAVDRVPNTIGPNSARLIGGNEYIFPLHPNVNTIMFLDAASASNAVYVRWVHHGG